ncbi:MAG: tetratricopeptide repeat protein [Candidatus Kryptoniota bacterium]
MLVNGGSKDSRRFFLLTTLFIVLFIPEFSIAQDVLTHSALMDSANALQKSGNLSAALSLYRKILKDYPDDMDAKVKLAQTMSWLGNLDSAIEIYSEVLRKDSLSYDSRLGLGLTLAWKKDYSKSLQILKSLMADYPRDTSVALAAARVALWSGNPQTTIQYTDKVLESYPNQCSALLIKATALVDCGCYSEARKIIRALTAILSDSPEVEALSQQLSQLFNNSITATYYLESYNDNNRPQNSIASMRIFHQVDKFRMVFFELQVRDFYGSRDIAGGLGGTYKFSDNLAANVGLLIGPATKAAQKLKLDMALDYRLIDGVVLSADYHYMYFPNLNVNIWSPASYFYFGSQSWILVRAYFGKSEGGSSSSYLGKINFQVNDAVTIQLSGFSGADYFKQSIQVFQQNLIASGFVAGIKWFNYAHLGIQVDYGISRWNSGLRSSSGDVLLIYRW